MSNSVQPHGLQHQASLSIANSKSLLKLMSIESVMPSNHLILCHPLLLLLSIFPSIRVLSNESILRIKWSKHWTFSFSISPSNEHPGWTGWISLLSKGLSRVFSNTQFKSINSSELSFLHGPTLTSIHAYWKNHTLTIRIFVGKVMSLLFNMLSSIVRAFLPRNKCLLIS